MLEESFEVLRPLKLTCAVKNFDDYDSFVPRKQIKQGHLHDTFMPVKEVRAKLDEIRGHLVWMPLDFLKDAEMAEKGMQVNAYTEVTSEVSGLHDT